LRYFTGVRLVFIHKLIIHSHALAGQPFIKQRSHQLLQIFRHEHSDGSRRRKTQIYNAIPKDASLSMCITSSTMNRWELCCENNDAIRHLSTYSVENTTLSFVVSGSSKKAKSQRIEATSLHSQARSPSTTPQRIPRTPHPSAHMSMMSDKREEHLPFAICQRHRTYKYIYASQPLQRYRSQSTRTDNDVD
jgi:hypothetical protein